MTQQCAVNEMLSSLTHIQNNLSAVFVYEINTNFNPLEPNDIYAASHGAGFNSRATQHLLRLTGHSSAALLELFSFNFDFFLRVHIKEANRIT